ncbi:MarR family transcriptional regulator [Bdellovibrio sp. 22V]|uniref:MarR family winged helix-turn-helix transcriptional regulator n=1 Tax=Bdellovibrio TaxID=958 RepID=UPI002542D8E5|nr:MarR family transcriptional regulator [Bdellovibrio sp. 22V]WII73528.1 MarR family transcriptional regulator [Bdellovibrio sp. 22V]
MNKKLKLENQICFPIYAASRLITQMYGEHFKKFDLTYPQYLVFLVLWEKSPRKVTEIADLLLLDTGTVTPLIKRMEQRGWLTRKRSKTDERSVQVFLTKEGRKMEERFQTLPDKLLCEVDCKKSDLDILKSQLNKLIGQMKETLEGGHHE